MDISTNRIGCVVLEGGTDEIIEKKSRFIAQVFPVQTEQEAMQIIEQTKKKYWDARHNCSAFVIGDRQEISRCSAEKIYTNDQTLDLLMIAKYYERLGDHATNVAEWVEFSLTGKHRSGKEVNDVFAVLQ